jgi:ABC-type lipoprotein export system ATPase subunit
MTLSAQSLTKRYGRAPGHEAVREASLDLTAGEFVSIVGRSGSGKSTLMAMLGALTRPTQGKLLLDGTDVWALSESKRANFRSRHIGFVFQVPSLLSNLTAADNVAVPALLGRTMDAGEAYARAHALIARVGLSDRADVYPTSMSGGEQRRVAIARALINSPRLLLADEPTSDLDEETENDIVDLLEELQRTDGFAFVLVTHDLALARRAQRTYEMRQGALAASPNATGELERWLRYPAPIKAAIHSTPPAPPAVPHTPIRLGSNLLPGLQTFLVTGAILLGGILLTDFAVAKYQNLQVRERGARVAALQHVALNSLSGDVQSVADLGNGRYELTTCPGRDDVAGSGDDARRWQRGRRIEDRRPADLSLCARRARARLHAAASQLHACPLLGDDSGQPQQHTEARRLRAQGQLLRLPEAVRRGRRGRAEADAVSGQAAGMDPDAGPLRSERQEGARP